METKEASFEALGYICEQVPEHLNTKSTIVLNAIATGMDKSQTNNSIKLAATNALSNSMAFTTQNFMNEGQRNLIMNMVFSASVSEDVKIRTAALQCLCEIANLYYDQLDNYFHAILQRTAEAITKDDENVGLQAIEFWSTICDEEISVQEEIDDGKFDRQYKKFMQTALPQLLPILLECLTKQSEDEADDDTWNLAMAAGSCLCLAAQNVKDFIVQPVLGFVEANFKNPNWRFREAAILAFGSVLDGPDRSKLVGVVSQALPIFLSHLNDEHLLVRDTAAWTIGQICNTVPEAIEPKLLPSLMSALIEGLHQPPKVASNVAWAISNLAAAVPSNENEKDSILSPYFLPLLTELFKLTETQQASEGNLMVAAYMAINGLINSAAQDMQKTVAEVITPLMGRLAKALTGQGLTTQERQKQSEIQGLLCGSLQVAVQKVTETAVSTHADNLMGLFLEVLKTKNSSVHQESFMAIGAVVNKVGKNFMKYMGPVSLAIKSAFSNIHEHHECVSAIGLIGDLSRALEKDFNNFSNFFMEQLLLLLQNNDVDKSVKPHVIACIGDIAMAVGGGFEKYLDHTMQYLVPFSQVQLHLVGNDVDFLNHLRESILEAYTGIIRGLEDDSKTELFSRYVDSSVGPFLAVLSLDKEKSDPLLRAAAGLVGDLASTVPNSKGKLANNREICALVEEASLSEEEQTQEIGSWAKQTLS